MKAIAVGRLRRLRHRRLVLVLIPVCILLAIGRWSSGNMLAIDEDVEIAEEPPIAKTELLTAALPSPPPPSPPPPAPPPPPLRKRKPRPKVVIPPRKDGIYKFFAEGKAYFDTNQTCPVAWEWTETRSEADVVLHNILDGSVGFSQALNGGELNRDYPEQLFAFMSLESGINYPFMYDVNDIGYNFSVDYRIWPDHPLGPADIPAVYMFNPTMPGFDIDFREPPKMPKRSDALMTAFISNCANLNGRLDVMKELMKRIGVHSYGNCLHNTDEPAAEGDRAIQKRRLSGEYKFLFTPENTNDVSYVTEKVYDAIAAGAVPVYMGAPDISRFVPHPSAVINVADFNSTAALADYLIELGADDEKYMKHFEWKKMEFTEDFKRVLRLATRTVECRMAMTLQGLDHEKDLKKLNICHLEKR